MGPNWRASCVVTSATPGGARSCSRNCSWRSGRAWRAFAAGVLGLCGWALVLVIAGGVVVLWQLHRRAGLRRLPPPAALFVAVIVLNRRGAAQLQRQIDALDAMADATVTR